MMELQMYMLWQMLRKVSQKSDVSELALTPEAPSEVSKQPQAKDISETLSLIQRDTVEHGEW
jgi:hypothetical protein